MFKLLESNPQLSELHGFYTNQTVRFRDSRFSNQVLVNVADVFAHAPDKSPFSFEFENQVVGDTAKRYLASAQFNFLQTLNLNNVVHVLDLSEDFGASAHYLSDHVGSVESVCTDQDMARLAVRRCVDKRNVRIILEELNDVSFPAAQYDLIVIGRLDNHDLDEEQLAKLLGRLQSALTPRGSLLINAQNSERLSCRFSPQANLNETGPDYVDLYQHYDQSLSSKSVQLNSLRRLLLDLGYANVDVHGTFSSGNDFANLFSEDYLTSAVDPLNHFYRNSSLNRDDLSEFLVYRQLFLNKQPLINVASRYLFVVGAHKQYTRALYDNDFSHYAGSGRKPEWRTNTLRSRAATVVQKVPKYPDLVAHSELIGQDTSDQPFQKGALLVNDWLDAVLENDANRLTELVTEYADWLNVIASNQTEFNRTAYDLLPFNILVTEKNEQRTFKTIDPEWQLKTDISPEFVLFRALFWFAFENKSLLRKFANEHHLFSIETFILQFAPSIALPEDLVPFVELEESIQAEIDSSFMLGAVELATQQSFDSELKIEDKTIAQAVWVDANDKADLSNLASTQVLKQAAAQVLDLQVKAPHGAKAKLRIDPLSCVGGFKINRLELLDSSSQTLHVLDTKAVLKSSSLNNIERADPSSDEPLLLAVSDDPYLMLDLTDVDQLNTENQAKVEAVRIELEWVWDEHYSRALSSLSLELANRNRTLLQQLSAINTLRSENQYQETTIKDLRDHRKTLMKLEREQEQRANKSEVQVNRLREALDQQRQKNDALYGFLLARPSTRARAFLSRMVNKLLRRPVHEVDTEVFKPPLPEPEPTPWSELLGQNTEDYGLWISENDLTPEQLEAAKQEIEAMPYKPVFSILVPIYNTDPEYLLPMIRSVQAQIYPHWQLCLVDDCSPKSYLRSILEHEASLDERISIRLNEVNQGISVTTNDALAMAKGDYIALLDHDDEITVDALYHNAKAINEDLDREMIYSDEDKMDMQGNREEPFFKPDYSQDLLETNNYICHFSVIKKSIMDQIGGFREGLDGSQDHDVILRAADAAKKVHHIQRILYHWRKIPGSTAVVYDAKSYAWEAGRKSVEDLLRKRESGVRVEFGSLKGSYRVFREIKGEPLISIIIPFKDKPELLRSCLNSILNRSSYQNFEVIGVSNNSEQPETKAVMQEFTAADERIKFVEHNVAFNFSDICNHGVEQSSGEYVLLLNNDIEVISSDWLERLLEHAQRPEIGAVGGKLLYPDGRIQHAGIVVGMVGAAGHPHKFFPDNHIGYHGRLHMVYNVSAVTGAMLMVARSKYDQVKGLDSKQLAVAYNDVDFCLKLMEAGYTNLFTPHCKATHHESVSRGYEDTPEKLERLLKEQKVFLERWSDFLDKGDPYYNPNLSLKKENFSLNFRD